MSAEPMVERVNQYRVLHEHETQALLPGKFSDDLRTALDVPAQPNEALARAARRAQHRHPLTMRSGRQAGNS